MVNVILILFEVLKSSKTKFNSLIQTTRLKLKKKKQKK